MKKIKDMAKKRLLFQFNFPLTKKVVRNCQFEWDYIGDLEIAGVGYFNPNASVIDVDNRYSADIDFVKWQGQDIKSVLEMTSEATMDEIFSAALQHIAGLFEQSIPEPMEGEKRSELFEQLAESIRIHNKIFYGI